MAMLNPMMTTDVAGNPCWMRPGGWTQVGILKTMGCMGSVVKPHKWLLLKRPWEFVKELFRTYLVRKLMGNDSSRPLSRREAGHVQQCQAHDGEQYRRFLSVTLALNVAGALA